MQIKGKKTPKSAPLSWRDVEPVRSWSSLHAITGWAALEGTGGKAKGGCGRTGVQLRLKSAF